MPAQRFRSRVEAAGRGGHFITIGRALAAKFGSRTRTPVRGHGTFYMVLNRTLRAALSGRLKTWSCAV